MQRMESTPRAVDILLERNDTIYFIVQLFIGDLEQNEQKYDSNYCGTRYNCP